MKHRNRTFYEMSASPLSAFPMAQSMTVTDEELFVHPWNFHYGHFEVNTKSNDPYAKYILYAKQTWFFQDWFRGQQPMFQPIFNLTG